MLYHWLACVVKTRLVLHLRSSKALAVFGPCVLRSHPRRVMRCMQHWLRADRDSTLRTIWCVKTPKTTSKTTSIMPPVFHKPQRPGFSAMRCASIPWLQRASRDGGQLHLVRLSTCPTIQASRATKEPKLQDYLISTWSVSYNVQESMSLKQFVMVNQCDTLKLQP